MSGRYRYCRLRRLAGVTMLVVATAVACGFGASASLAAEAHYVFDPVHTRVAFQVSHAGFSNAVGTFSRVEGELKFDDANWSLARLKVRIPISTLELGDANWREKILDRTFFDAGKFPEAVFESTNVEAMGNNTATVTGDLTMHGVTRPVTLAVTMNALRRHPLTFRKTAGFSATGSLRRSDFGMNAWKNLVGDEVRLVIEAEAVRDSGSNDSDDETEAESKGASDDAAK